MATQDLGSVNFAGSANESPMMFAQFAAASTISADSSFTASATVDRGVAAAISVSASVTASATAAFAQSLAISATASFAASGTANRGVNSSITGTASTSDSAVANRGVTSIITTTALCSSVGIGHYAGQTTIVGLGSMTATATEGPLAICSIVALSVCTAISKAHWVCHAAMVANSAFGVGVPTVKGPFVPVANAGSSIPTVRKVPQGTPKTTYTIQPPRPPVQPGGNQRVNVKR